MHPLSTTTSFLLTLLFSLHLTTSFSSNDISNLSNCNQNFSCGNLTNVTYPFTGGLRPPHCGPPQFRLTCDDDSVTTLTANSLLYRVTHLDQTSQTLRLSRSDFVDNSACTLEYKNTTLDDSFFSLGSNHVNLSLYYGCKKINDPDMASDPKLPNFRFSCDIQGVTEEGFFAIVYPVGGYPYPDTSECQNNIQVPIPGSQARWLLDNGSFVGEVLKEGFDANYRNPYSDDCTKCYKKHSGGHCGFDAQLGKLVCICNDQLCPGFSRSDMRLHIAVGISAAVAVIITFSIIIICLTRKEGSFSVFIARTFRLKNSQHVDKVHTFMMDYHSLTPKRYSYSDIKKMTNSFVNILGHGGFGNVYKGKLSDGRLVAVKVLKESKGNGEEFINEVASISRTSHVNIVSFLGFCYERNKRVLIYEFMPNGSLDSFISNKESPDTNYRLEWKKLYEIAVGIARGLEYLHRGCNTQIVHFDIKPHNILLDEDFCPKISDFGLAKLCKNKVSKISMLGVRGTVGYIAPEVFCRNFGGVTYKSDVYSYGMMTLEMVGQSKDFDMGSLETNEMYFPDWFYMYLESVDISTLHGGIMEEEEEIVKKMILVGLWCIQTIPSHRPSMTKVVEMFEGSLQSLQIPPRPFLSSPRRSAQEHSSIVSSLPCVSSQGDGINKLSAESHL